MEQIATLPPVIALQLVEELHAAGIPAETTDMAPGVAAAVYPGLLEATLTVWVRDPEDAVRARAVLEEMQASFSVAEAFDDDDDDPSVDEADPSRPDPSQVSRRRRVAHLAVLLLWLGPPAIIIMLGLLLVSLFAVGGVG